MSTSEPKSSSKSRFSDWLVLTRFEYFKPENVQNLKYKCPLKVLTPSTENSIHKTVSKSKKNSAQSKLTFRHNYSVHKSLEIYKKTNIYTRLRLYNAAKLIPRVMSKHKIQQPVTKPVKVEPVVSAASSKQEVIEKKSEIKPVNVVIEKKTQKVVTMLPRPSVTKVTKKEIITMTKITLDANSLIPKTAAEQSGALTRLQREKMPKRSINIGTVSRNSCNTLVESLFLPDITNCYDYSNSVDDYLNPADNYCSLPALPTHFRNKVYCNSRRIPSSIQ